MVELLSALVWVRRHGEAFVNGTRELMAMPGLWLMPAIPAPQRLEQEDRHEFEVSLGYSE